MRLETVKTSVERGGNFQEKAFTIKADAKMFNLLSDKIYADKPGAVVREIASNAKDAHAAAGCPEKPFDIHLPNDMYPHFSVRDYGKGLTHEEMFEIYTTYSESTKTITNTEIGAFGVGAKSPFAYTDNFTIVSRTEGRKRTYTAYIGEEGIPVLALMNDEENDEPTGLEVIVPIKNYDFQTFRNKTFNVLQYFTPRPNVVGIATDYINFDDHSYVYEGTGWGVRKNRGGARVIQGGVFYPIDFQAVFERNVPRHLYNLTNQALDLHFSMFNGVGERGNLDVALSREALSYDQYTREQLQKMMQIVYDEIGDRVVKDLDNIETYWEACKKYAEIKNTFGDLIPDNLKWKGDKELKRRLNFNVENYREHLEITAFANQRGYRTGSTAGSIYGEFNAVKMFIVDVERGAKSRMKEFVRSHGRNHSFMIEIKSKSPAAKRMYKQLLEELGHPPTERISSLPKPTVHRTGYKKQVQNEKMECLKWNGYRHRRQKDKWDRATVELKDGGYYVPVEMYNIVIADDYKITSLDTLTNEMATLGIIPHGVKVCGVSKRTAKHLEGVSNWKNLVQLAIEKCSDKSVEELVVRESLRNNIDSTIRYGQKSDIGGMFSRANNQGKKFRELITKVTNKDVKKLMEMMLEYEPTSDETYASTWQSLSTHVRVHHGIYAETEKKAKEYVDTLVKLWESVVAKNSILQYVSMSNICTDKFDEAFIQLVNKGV